MSNVYFLGSVVPPANSAIADAFSYAGNASQLGVINGLVDAGVSVRLVISYVPNRVFPFGSKLIVGRKEYFYNGVRYICLPYLNLPGFREITFNFFALIVLLRIVLSRDVIISYNIGIPSGVVPWLLRLFRQVKIIVLAYDVHIPGETVPDSFRWRFEFLKHKWLLPKFSGVVAINKNIIDDFGCRDGIVVEGGVAEVLPLPCFESVASTPHFTIVYAGRLTAENGISLILTAFHRINRSDVKLVIMGEGPLCESVVEAANNDKRIIFLGLVPHSEVLEAYSRADLLLCVRLTELVNTRFFFPSKLIEYMTSGVPVLSTLVSGASFDLAEYVYLLPSETVESLAESLEKIYLTPKEERRQKAAHARIFAKEYFLWKNQARRIKEFIEKL